MKGAHKINISKYLQNLQLNNLQYNHLPTIHQIQNTSQNKLNCSPMKKKCSENKNVFGKIIKKKSSKVHYNFDVKNKPLRQIDISSQFEEESSLFSIKKENLEKLQQNKSQNRSKDKEPEIIPLLQEDQTCLPSHIQQYTLNQSAQVTENVKKMFKLLQLIKS